MGSIRNKSVFSILYSKLRRYTALAVKNIEVNFMFLARLLLSLQYLCTMCKGCMH